MTSRRLIDCKAHPLIDVDLLDVYAQPKTPAKTAADTNQKRQQDVTQQKEKSPGALFFCGAMSDRDFRVFPLAISERDVMIFYIIYTFF